MGNTLVLPREICQVIGSELPYSTKIVLASVCKNLRQMQNTIEFQSIASTPSNHSRLSQMYDYANIQMYIHYPPVANVHDSADCVEHRYKVVLYDAIKRGDEQVAIWASEHITNLDSVWNEYIPCLAVLSGKIETFEWVKNLFKNDDPFSRSCYTIQTLECSVAENNTAMIEIILNKCMMPASYPSSLFSIAAETGSVELLEWLKKHLQHDPSDFDIDFSVTIKLGHWDAFNWFMANSQFSLHVTRLFDACLKYNRVDVAKRFIRHHLVVSCYSHHMTETVAANGYLELLQLLFSVNCPYNDHLACVVPAHHEEVIKYLADVKGLHACDSGIVCRARNLSRIRTELFSTPTQEFFNALFVKNPSEISQLVKSNYINDETAKHFKDYMCHCVHPHIHKAVKQHTVVISQVAAEPDVTADFSVGWLLFILAMIIYMVTEWSLYLFF